MRNKKKEDPSARCPHQKKGAAFSLLRIFFYLRKRFVLVLFSFLKEGNESFFRREKERECGVSLSYLEDSDGAIQ